MLLILYRWIVGVILRRFQNEVTFTVCARKRISIHSQTLKLSHTIRCGGWLVKHSISFYVLLCHHLPSIFSEHFWYENEWKKNTEIIMVKSKCLSAPHTIFCTKMKCFVTFFASFFIFVERCTSNWVDRDLS